MERGTRNFLTAIESYLAASGMDATSFGRRAVNDPSYVFRLRRGRSSRLDTAERVQAYMAANPIRVLDPTEPEPETARIRGKEWHKA